MSGTSYRGVSAAQDGRYRDKEQTLLKKLKDKGQFPAHFDQKVDMAKVQLEVMRPWIAEKVGELLGFEDDVVVEYVNGMLEGKDNRTPDPRKMQLSLTGFLESKTPQFMAELWTLLLSAQTSVGGIPQEFVERKKQELREARQKDAGAIRDSGVIHYQGGGRGGGTGGERGRGRGGRGARGRGGSRWDDGNRRDDFRDRQGNVTQRVQDAGWGARGGPRYGDGDDDRTQGRHDRYAYEDSGRRRSPSPRYNDHRREDRYNGHQREVPRSIDGGSRPMRPRYDDDDRAASRYAGRRFDEKDRYDGGRRRRDTHSPSSPDRRRYRSPTYSPDGPSARRPRDRSLSSPSSRSPSPRPVFSRRRRSPDEHSRSPSPPPSRVASRRPPTSRAERSESYDRSSPLPSPRRSRKRRDSYSDSEEDYTRRAQKRAPESSVGPKGDETPDYRQRSRAKVARRSPSYSPQERTGSRTPIVRRSANRRDSPSRSPRGSPLRTREEAEAKTRAMKSREKKTRTQSDEQDVDLPTRSSEKVNVLAKSKWATSDDEA